MKGGLSPFPHRGDSRFSANIDTGRSQFPSRPLDVVHLGGGWSGPPRRSPAPWQPGPAVLPGALVGAGLGPRSSSAALQTNPARVGRTVGALHHSANISGGPGPVPARTQRPAWQRDGHWPQGPHSGHAEERGAVGSRDDESGLREPGDQFAREHGASVLTLDRLASAKLEGTRLWLRRKARPRALVAGQGALGALSRGYSEAGEGEVRALGRSGPGRPRDSPNHRLRALQGPRGHSETRCRTCERRGASVGAQGPQPGPFRPGPPPVWVQSGQSVFPPPCPQGQRGSEGAGDTSYPPWGGGPWTATSVTLTAQMEKLRHAQEKGAQAARETRVLHPGHPTAGQASTATHLQWAPKTRTQNEPEPTSQEAPRPKACRHTYARCGPTHPGKGSKGGAGCCCSVLSNSL